MILACQGFSGDTYKPSLSILIRHAGRGVTRIPNYQTYLAELLNFGALFLDLFQVIFYFLPG